MGALLIGLGACSKQLSVKSPSFNVTTDSSAYQHGSPVKFLFAGNPDNVVFYSGTWGNRYAYSQRLSDSSGIDTLSFYTAVTAGSGSLSLMVSSDWDGLQTPADLQSATWTDISSRAQWATGTIATYSGTIDLGDFKTAGKPIYLAFRYTAAAGAAQNKWSITKFALLHKPAGDTTYTLATLANVIPAYAVGAPSLVASPGWDTVNVSSGGFTWSPAVAAASTTTLSITGNTNAATATAVENWTIAGPVDLTRVLHDVPTAIVKNITTNLEELSPPLMYVYPLPGTYTATFVGVNATSNALDSAIRSVAVQVQ